MNKFLAFLLSFSILNSSFAEDLLCPCSYSNYFKNYQDGKSFATDGLDVYVVDDFTVKGTFDDYYKPFFEEDKEDFFLPKEQYNINAFFEDGSSDELHFSNHKNPWYWHIYKKEDSKEYNKEDSKEYNYDLIQDLAKKMSTKGGNNFDWENGVDKARWFNRFRSKVRHNKNVIIVKLKNAKDELFKNTIFTFRKFVNMSYCPVPIIFTGNFEYNDFEKNLNSFNKEYTNNNGGNENDIVIPRGVVDKRQEIDSQKCFYIKQDDQFVGKVKELLKEAFFHHNFKTKDFNGKTFNIAIIGLPRSGKSLCTNIILDNLAAKVANDVTSVTQGKTPYFHRDVANIPIKIIDTPGFEPNKENNGSTFINWLLKESIDENGLNKRRIDDIHVIVYFINAKNFPKPEDFGKSWTDSAGKSRGNEFYLKEELKLFKLFKEEKVPVVFVIAQSHSFENGYKYLKKWFGDLALSNDLSNYEEKTKDWKAEDQWICPKWTRGTLLQLKNDPIEGSNKYTGKYGLVKLMNIIGELFNKNKEYRNRIPKTFDDNRTVFGILDNLKNQFKNKGFNDDEKDPPIFEENKDIIVQEVDKKIPGCLNELHDAYIERNFIQKKLISMAEKKIINAFAKGENYSFFGEEINFSEIFNN